jgi:hypothetical protein
MTQDELYANIARLHDEELKLITRKNKDYSNFQDPFANFRIFGELGFLVRISDKLMRLKQLQERNSPECKDETYEDSLMDLSNYCNLLLSYRKEQNEK